MISVRMWFACAGGRAYMLCGLVVSFNCNGINSTCHCLAACLPHCSVLRFRIITSQHSRSTQEMNGHSLLPWTMWYSFPLIELFLVANVAAVSGISLPTLYSAIQLPLSPTKTYASLLPLRDISSLLDQPSVSPNNTSYDGTYPALLNPSQR